MDSQSEQLTLDEISSLEAELRNYYITAVALTLIVIGFMHALIFIKFNQWTVPKYEAIVLAAMIIISLILSGKFIKPLKDEIEQGLKIIDYRIIDSKYDYLDRDFEDSALYTKYVIIAAGKKYVVHKDVYEKAETLDFLAIHRSPLREKQLKIEIFKSRKSLN